jgi:hypothetical protein
MKPRNWLDEYDDPASQPVTRAEFAMDRMAARVERAFNKAYPELSDGPAADLVTLAARDVVAAHDDPLAWLRTPKGEAEFVNETAKAVRQKIAALASQHAADQDSSGAGQNPEGAPQRLGRPDTDDDDDYSGLSPFQAEMERKRRKAGL